jgi:hypothetical protein
VLIFTPPVSSGRNAGSSIVGCCVVAGSWGEGEREFREILEGGGVLPGGEAGPMLGVQYRNYGVNFAMYDQHTTWNL